MKSKKLIFKNIHLIVLLCFCTYSCQGRRGIMLPAPILEKGWNRVSNEIAQIDIPSTMEEQSGEYRHFMDSIRITYNYSPTIFTIQQADLQISGLVAFSRYARIILVPTRINIAEFVKFSDTVLKKMTQNQLTSSVLMKSWYPSEKIEVNGMEAYHVKYVRQFTNKPAVLVNQYYILYDSSVFCLTMSYRLNDVAYWNSNFKKILNTLRIKKNMVMDTKYVTLDYSDVNEEIMQYTKEITPQENLEQNVAEINLKCPVMINDECRFDSSDVLPGMIINSHYTLVHLNKKDLDNNIIKEIESQLKGGMIQSLKTSRRYGFYKTNKVCMIYTFHDKIGKILSSTKIESNEY